jgi:hypothetical protein
VGSCEYNNETLGSIKFIAAISFSRNIQLHGVCVIHILKDAADVQECRTISTMCLNSSDF